MEPVRTCVGCRRRDSKASLLRLVWDVESGAVVLDRAARRPGRGCYLHAGCSQLVERRGAVARGLRRRVDPAQVGKVLAALADLAG